MEKEKKEYKRINMLIPITLCNEYEYMLRQHGIELSARIRLLMHKDLLTLQQYEKSFSS